MNLSILSQADLDLAASVEYPVIAVTDSSGTVKWSIAADNTFMHKKCTDALLTFAAGKSGRIADHSVSGINTGAAADDFVKKNTAVLNITVENGEIPANAAAAAAEIVLGGGDDFFCIYGGFSYAEANLLNAAAEFIHSQLAFINRDAYKLCEIRRFMGLYPEILRKLTDKFLAGNKDFSAENAAINALRSGIIDKDAKVHTVLLSLSEFFRCIIRSNFDYENKTALAFKLDPSFMGFFEKLSDKYTNAFPPERPFGIFFFYRSRISGFQIRFAPIARGGWRTVVPKAGISPLDKYDAFDQAHCEIFREGFVLANTQHKKNKDIYEGGSKMAAILENLDGDDFKTVLWSHQRAIFEAFLALLLRDPEDIVEIGPDENMFDEMITYMGDRAEKENYALKSGIISGKVDTGINHKHYGVTSFGVFQYLMHTLKYLNIDPAADEFDVILSGGPFGDVAGNMIKLLNSKNDSGSFNIANVRIVAVTDGPAAVYDPAGIDREELSSLVHKAALDAFDSAKLHGEGAFMIWSNADENGKHRMDKIVSGKLQTSAISRDEFMTYFQNNIFRKAAVFIPCGGRPQTINDTNWRSFLDGDKPVIQAIVEGANSFITPAARLKLQNAGIVNVKDSSANKCGVITSSFEIMSGLLLDKEEFAAYKDVVVSQIMDKLAACANKEAAWLFEQFKARKNVPMTALSDELADRINELKAALFDLFGEKPELLDEKLIIDHLPEAFRKEFVDRIVRIPVPYRKAIAAAEAANRMVYTPEDAGIAHVVKALNA